ncbi:MFS transporter [Dactylosporangium sp. CA-052675]|uniref:MFS transporter n=1 Tax=Dactylosporangium sp. CA-052675 TaxID=3239927 RepID=UPI003D8B09D4
MKQAALGTAVVFTASGAVVGGWVSRIPAVVERLGIGPGELGRALLALGLGSLVSMPVTGHACRRFGSRAWVAGTALVSAVALAAAGLAGSLWALGGALFVLGLAYGSWDVAMNVQGSFVDRRAGREWMPRYHACWSLGSIGGAAAGSLAARAGIGAAPHLAVAAVVSLAVTYAGLTLFLDERTDERTDGRTDERTDGRTDERTDERTDGRADGGTPERTDAGTAAAPGRRRFCAGRALPLIGLATLCATVVEGAAGDWLALFLHTGRGLSQSSAALGYTLFATAMTAGRFAGSTAVARLGRARAVRLGALLGVAGIAAAVLAPGTGPTYAGALLWGLGVCLVFPAAVSAAGQTARPAEAIALVTSIGYGSLLVGPPLIGALADAIGLGRALLGLAGLAAAIAALAPVLRSPAQSGSASIAR